MVGLGSVVEGRWFHENIVKEIGDGNDTHFLESGVGWGDEFSHKFLRLFHLCIDKSCNVSSMGEWVEDLWV